MLCAYISHPDCLQHDMGPGHPECPERLHAISDMLLSKGYSDFMVPYDAPQASVEQLTRAHSALYVNELLARAPTEGYERLDPDTLMNPHTVLAALRAAGAAVLATDLVLRGEVATAFCNIRPPGHHAERSACMGFCFFNNVAVGIRHALDAHGLARVALIDFDVHHGNGSADILAGDDRVDEAIVLVQRQASIHDAGGPPRHLAGMRRRGFTHTRLKLIREFYEELFHGVGQFAARLEKMRSSGSSDPAIVEILAFIDAGGKRPLTKANPRKTVDSASNEG